MIHRHCSFCDAQESDHNPLIAGTNVYICKNCVFSAYKIMFGDSEGENTSTQENKHTELLTPKELNNFLVSTSSGSNELVNFSPLPCTIITNVFSNIPLSKMRQKSQNRMFF